MESIAHILSLSFSMLPSDLVSSSPWISTEKNKCNCLKNSEQEKLQCEQEFPIQKYLQIKLCRKYYDCWNLWHIKHIQSQNIYIYDNRTLDESQTSCQCVLKLTILHLVNVSIIWCYRGTYCILYSNKQKQKTFPVWEYAKPKDEESELRQHSEARERNKRLV